MDINYTVADLTRQYLQQEGIDVDLMKEFDDYLDGYEGNALISIHADTCEYIPDLGTGFKIAEAVENKRPEQAARLMADGRYEPAARHVEKLLRRTVKAGQANEKLVIGDYETREGAYVRTCIGLLESLNGLHRTRARKMAEAVLRRDPNNPRAQAILRAIEKKEGDRSDDDSLIIKSPKSGSPKKQP